MTEPVNVDASLEPSVLTERRGRVLVITLNRPAQRNSINGMLATQLCDAFEVLDNDPGLAAAVLSGNGQTFCAGMDLKAFARGESMAPFMDFIKRGSQKPLIGAIEGFALGGGLELALMCDLLVAANDAKLGLPETKVGLLAGGGGLIRLPGRIGFSKAMEMAITSEPISAAEALECGLLARVTEPGAALDVALELAERVTRNAPLAVAASKQIIRAAQGIAEDALWAVQSELSSTVFTSNDAKEGPRAFAEKRPPEWTGT